MVLHSETYQKLVREGLKPGRCISVEAAEHLSGLPRNWTSPTCGMVNSEDIRRYFPAGEAMLSLWASFLSCASVLPDAVNIQIRFESLAGFQEDEMHLTLLRVRRSWTRFAPVRSLRCFFTRIVSLLLQSNLILKFGFKFKKGWDCIWLTWKFFHGSHLRFNLVKMPSLPLMLSFFFQPWRLCAQWESIRSSHSVECADMSHRMTDSNKPRKRYIYASTYLSFLLSFFLFSSLSIYRSTDGSLDLFACLSIYLSILLIFHLGWSPKRHPQVPKSFIKFRENTVFWRLAGAFFGEPT